MKKSILILFMAMLFPLSVYAGDNVEVDSTIINDSEETVVTDDTDNTETVINENTKKITNKYFDLTLEQKAQSAFNKRIPYVLTVVPHIDSSKTQIIWNVPSTLDIKMRHKEFVSLSEGQTYTFKGEIIPLRSGTYDFSVSVVSWQHNTNYTNAIDDTVVLNKGLVLQPVSIEYQVLSVFKILGILIGVGIIIFVVIILGKKYMKKAKKWLTPPS